MDNTALRAEGDVAVTARRPGLWPKLLLAAGALAVALLCAEMVVRALKLAPDLIRIRPEVESSAFQLSDNPILGYEMRPHAPMDDADGRTNAHGQWDVDRTIAKPPGVRRILVLGDSVAVGADAGRLEDNITGQLERMLAGGNVEVLNFGVTGYCTLAEVELLRVKGLRFAPDLVVVLFMWNDHDNFNNNIGQVSFPRPAWTTWLLVRSALFRAWCWRADLYDFRRQHEINQAPGHLWPIEPDALRAEVAATPDALVSRHVLAMGDNNVVAGLVMLRDLADKHGFEVLIAIWPAFGPKAVMDVNHRTVEGPWRKAVWHGEPAQPGIAPARKLSVELLAQRLDLPCVRLSEHFAEDLVKQPAGTEPMALYTKGDGMHPNRHGCRVAAEALRNAIKLP